MPGTRKGRVIVMNDHLRLENNVVTLPAPRRNAARPLGAPTRARERKGFSQHARVCLGGLHAPPWTCGESILPEVVLLQPSHLVFELHGGVKLENRRILARQVVPQHDLENRPPRRRLRGRDTVFQRPACPRGRVINASLQPRLDRVTAHPRFRIDTAYRDPSRGQCPLSRAASRSGQGPCVFQTREGSATASVEIPSVDSGLNHSGLGNVWPEPRTGSRASEEGCLFSAGEV